MREKLYLLALISIFAFAFVACGEGTETKVGDDDDDTTDDDDSAKDDDDDTADDDDSAKDDDDDTADDDDSADDDDDNDDDVTSAACSKDSDCGGKNICLNEVCMAKPDKEGITQFGKIDNSCIGDTVDATGKTAIIEGCLDAFGLDQSTVGATIEIYLLGKKGEIGDLITTAVTEKVGVDKCKNHSAYVTSDPVPLDTQLVYKTYGDRFVDSYQYNKLIPSEDESDGKVSFKYSATANIIATSTYNLIPTLAGIGSVDDGKGAIAGEIHDCTDHEVENAVVGMSPIPSVIVYFQGTDPDPIATSTDPDATYAGVNTVPGPYRISAATLKDGQVANLGVWNVKSFADSVTILTFNHRTQPF